MKTWTTVVSVVNRDQYCPVPTPMYLITVDKTLWHILLFVATSRDPVLTKKEPERWRSWRAREREPITRVWRQSPQWGPGAKPLVRGWSPPEVESILKCRLQIFAVKCNENLTMNLFFLVQLCSYRSWIVELPQAVFCTRYYNKCSFFSYLRRQKSSDLDYLWQTNK